MYYEHPFKIDGVYYAKIDGAMIEITEELVKAMLSFYRNKGNLDPSMKATAKEDTVELPITVDEELLAK